MCYFTIETVSEHKMHHLLKKKKGIAIEAKGLFQSFSTQKQIADWT